MYNQILRRSESFTNSATNIILTGAGATLLILVFYDIYATILRATKHPGPFSEFLNRGLWWVAKRATQNLDRRQRRILSAVGPLLMPMLIALLILMMLTGFALIYLPRLETGFQITESPPARPLLQALYFSGVTLLTIGYGDILPVSGATRVIALVEGACGIAVISLAITYLLTVYRALERKRALALNFYHQARQGADIPGFISNHFARGRFHSLTETLREATRDLQKLLKSHIEHPVIHYFHPVEVYKGFPRALFVVLETEAILNAHVDEAEYIEAGDHPVILIAGDNARHVLAELLSSLKLEKRANDPFESEAKAVRRRRKSFDRAIRHLGENKIRTRTDLEKAFEEYSEDRSGWESKLFHFADYLGYDWNEVTGDRDLQDATDDEVIERHEGLTAESGERSSDKR